MPLRYLILFFAMGAALLQRQATLPDLRWAALLPLLLAVSAGFSGLGRWRVARLFLVTLLAFGCGFFYAAWRAEIRLSAHLPSVWEGRDVRLQGRVLGLPEATPRGTRLVLAVDRTLTPGASIPDRVQVTLFNFALSGKSTAKGLSMPRGGDCLEATVRLVAPRASLNPGGFDYEGWLLERGIRAQGYVVGIPMPVTACAASPIAALDAWREAIRQRLGVALAGKPFAGVLIALAVGDQNAISDAQWSVFRTTGVTHLMSISGLHVTLLASLVFAFTQWAWRRSTLLSNRLPARKAAALAGLGTAGIYVALAGFGLPAQRTLYMLATLAASLWLNRLVSPSRLLAAALAVVVVIDPWAALAPGFWLSFGAVAVLLYTGSARLGQPAAWLVWLRAQWAVTLMLCPALLSFFHELSLVSPLANAFAIPVISLLVVPLVLASVILPVDGLAQLAHALIALTMSGLDWLATLPQPVWHGAAPDWPVQVLAILGVAVLLMPRGLPARWLGIVLLLPLFFPRLERPGEGEFWLETLDVGQGLAVVVRTASRTLVYDTGPVYASGEDAGRRVLAPYLFGQGIDRLDGLVVSHADNDHHGGTSSLLASHAPRWRLASMPLPGVALCHAGQQWRWDGVRFEILHPARRLYAQGGFPENDLSCVLRITGRHGRALLTGDIERLGELSLLELPAAALRAEVQVVPHHGSGGSSMAKFVEVVDPQLALFSVGRRNRFGHPDPAVLQRYRITGAAVHRTDREGALMVRVVPGGLKVEAAREVEPRYWHVSPTQF